MKKETKKEKKKYWVKGGIIGAILSAFLILIVNFIPNLEEKIIVFIILAPIIVPLIFFSFFHGYLTAEIFGVDPYLGASSFGSFVFIIFLPFISTVILYSLIGALVGYFYGELKSRKTK